MKALRRTKEQTSYIMSRIRGKDTGIEMTLRMELRRRHLRYRKNVSSLPGKPDVVFAKYKVAIFCDGEFWHGYDWATRQKDLKSNRSFWIEKIERNMARDREINRLLRVKGWKVLRFWGRTIEQDVTRIGARIEATLVDRLLDRLLRRFSKMPQYDHALRPLKENGQG